MKDKARSLLKEFKGDDYAFGLGVLDQVGKYAGRYGKTCVLMAGFSPWSEPVLEKVRASLAAAGVTVVKDVKAARPNSPIADVQAAAKQLESAGADMIVVVGGGSAIDGAKASNVLCTYTGESADINDYFGVGKVTAAKSKTGRDLLPLVAVESASGSAAHLTKYSNITNLDTGQKKLIVDAAVVPPAAVFDYAVTASMGKDFTLDGAFDGISHCLEVYYGASAESMELIERIALAGIELILADLAAAVSDPADLSAREAMGLGTDLGGYAIMVGGTNGGHLTSFSLVDVLPHGRACAIMNPYYTVFFAPAIERQLRRLAEIFARRGYLKADTAALAGYDLGKAAAEAMFKLADEVGFPKTLGEVPGFTDAHIARVLAAAKDPALENKLKNMPIPLTAAEIDEKMGPILQAARTGNLDAYKPSGA